MVDRLEKAAAALKGAVELSPYDAGLLDNLGNLLQHLGRVAEAVPLYHRALAIAPEAADIHGNLGAALSGLGRQDEAIAAFHKALALNPAHPDIHNNLGAALRRAGRPDEALIAFDRALALRPDYAEALGNQGNALKDLGRLNEAVAAYHRALTLRPDSVGVLNNLGAALLGLGQATEAAARLGRAQELQPNYAEALSNLGSALTELGRPAEAVTTLRRAIERSPGHAAAFANLGIALAESGQAAEAVAAYRQAASLSPDRAETQSNLLMSLNYLAETTAEKIFAEARRFAARFEPAPPSPPFANHPVPTRRLKVGYVSADFRRHPVGYFLKPALRRHDPAQVEVYCYDNAAWADDLTDELRGLAPHWRVITGMSTEAASAAIAADGIDILVDLSGHTAHNRLDVFARRSAPVQATWLGYWGTTGLSAIDYLLADAATPVPEDERWYSERILRLPGCRFCYEPPEYAPPPRAPMNGGGLPTFGSFNHLAKLGPETVELWAAVLRAVPTAHLLLKWKSLGEPATREAVRARFQAAGIAAERVELRGASPHPEMLAEYGAVDIALDPVLFSGGLTSCEALWMGVPVITLKGAYPPARQTAAFLEALALNDLIADTPDRYVAIASALAADSRRIERLRAELRPRMAASPLCQAKAFTRNLEDAYRRMWKAWCASAA